MVMRIVLTLVFFCWSHVFLGWAWQICGGHGTCIHSTHVDAMYNGQVHRITLQTMVKRALDRAQIPTFKQEDIIARALNVYSFSGIRSMLQNDSNQVCILVLYVF